jgi:hypothetical protein
LFPITGFQPLPDEFPSWHRANTVQDKVMAEVDKGSVNVSVQEILVSADSTVMECHVNVLYGILTAASRVNLSRGCHDAIQRVFTLARPNTARPWVLDADIEGAFNNIGHSALV